MPYTTKEKKQVLARVRRIRGQIDALERAVEEGVECGAILQQIAAARGAINGLMAGVLESHLRETLASPQAGGVSQEAVDDIIALVRSYLR